MLDGELEEAYFGEKLGNIGLYQISAQQFQLQCLSSNLKEAGDSTGLRAYAGCHVVIRFLATFPHFVEQKNVVELGCGIGVFGLVGTHLSHPTLLVLTDGQARGRNILKKNIQHFCTLSTTPTFSQQLRWSNLEETQQVLELCKQSKGSNTSHYDVVLGSELMYFNTSVELMVQAVMSLTQNKGLFIHGHLFRGYHLEHQLITLLAVHNWTTIEIPHKEFISVEEMKQGAKWYGVRSLISGPQEVIAKLVEEYPSWREFTEKMAHEEVQDESAIFSVFE